MTLRLLTASTLLLAACFACASPTSSADATADQGGTGGFQTMPPVAGATGGAAPVAGATGGAAPVGTGGTMTTTPPAGTGGTMTTTPPAGTGGTMQSAGACDGSGACWTTCNSCATAEGGPCRAVDDACAADTACTDLIACRSNCTQANWDQCAGDCEAASTPDAKAKLDAISECVVCTACPVDCSGQWTCN